VPKDIAENRTFENISQLWLEDEHYKWRAMRANGIAEKYITGVASDYEKFTKWSETVPYTLRNPLYHWTHLELKNPFGIHEVLNASTAESIYKNASRMLSSKELSTHALLQKFNVVKLCSTDDPTDTLEWHRMIKKSDLTIVVAPTWRPDKAMKVSSAVQFKEYVAKLAQVSNLEITTFDEYRAALQQRHDYFHQNGCRLADHGLEFPFPISEHSEKEVQQIFKKLITGKDIPNEEQIIIKSSLLLEFARWNAEKEWVQQFHIGAIRNVNSNATQLIGAAKGFDSISDFSYANSMGQFLNLLEKDNKLAKTIIYNLNPSDNDMVASMIGNFQDGKTPGKLQFGAAWWFLDQKYGIENHLNTVSVHGLLRRFVGMVTDSRSLLSYSRHEYFRRILCNLIAQDVINGEIPQDMELLGQMIEEVCYTNADRYFNF